jgi:glycosyltransferase involved in cell wall biosynthesis
VTAPTFTVLLPVHRPPALLPYAVQSVLRQSRADLELFVICDGAPAATFEAAQAFAAADARVRVFVHPKGERHGEAYRHLALQQARGRYVCQIGDDDLWFDNHLAEAERLMAGADFGNLFAVQVRADGTPQLQFADLALPAVRTTMLGAQYNFFGPTASVYSLDAYRALPVGWSPAPADFWTDLWMWRKFLVQPGLRFATRPVPTSLGFLASMRSDWSLDQRRDELRRYAELIPDAAARDELWRAALLDAAAQMIRVKVRAYDQVQRLSAAAEDAARLVAALKEIVSAKGDARRQRRLAQAAIEAHQRTLG